MDIWIVLLHDSECGCFGVSEPMNEKECGSFIENAIRNGYDFSCVSLTDLFKYGHQDLDVHKCK